jgi:P-type Ca2+ transporter type 2C
MTTDWHSLSVPAALDAARTTTAGLSKREAAARLIEFGPNTLRPSKPVSAARILQDQLASVVVALLLFAGTVSAVLGDYYEAAAIAAVLVINTGIGFFTEWRARRAMEALRGLDVLRASVVRDGHLQTVDAETLVPGDVVEIAAGRRVPADGRLVLATDLRVSEAALTGESLPVSKTEDAVLDASTALAERNNMVFKSAAVVAGIGRAIVTATGAETEVGRIGTLVDAVVQERTPLERKLDALGRRLVWITVAVAALVSLLGALNGASLLLVIETGVALAVAAVPEALPAVVTIALAVGMRRMARRHALVRRLPAVETLGSTTVVCTDKTRTLTSGDMTVVRVWTAGREWGLLDGQDGVTDAVSRIVGLAALASRHQAQERGAASLADPVDAAILQAADRVTGRQAPVPEVGPVAGIVPFSSDRKFMAVIHHAHAGFTAFAKGAPQRMIERSGRVLTSEGEREITPEHRNALLAVNDSLAGRGLRVLGVVSGSVEGIAEDQIRNLTFVGFLGLADPPAPGVKETIARLRTAGLRTVMLTGDQRLTAQTVGRDLGVLGPDDESLDGRELDRLRGDELRAAIATSSVFSRVTAEHKLVIVTSLQAGGEIVAMLGDGVNDAAALKKADVGVAMGLRGTDVAKEASAIVLQNDRFESIAAAVEEGRIIFDNIGKFVFYLFSCNVAEVLVLLVAGLAALPLPLAPLQLLWLNMVTDTFPALALALEPGDPDVMSRPPRHPQQAILSRRFFSSVLGFGLVITSSTLVAFGWALVHAPERASTMAFMTLALAQIGHLGNARSSAPVLRLERVVANRYALVGVACALVLQGAAAFLDPLANALRVVPLRPRDWLVVIACASAAAVVGQALKSFPSAAARRNG